MSQRRQVKLSQAASTAALGASGMGVIGASGPGEPPLAGARPTLFDADMGQANSPDALARLNRELAELRAISLAPLLQRATAAIAAHDYASAADLALKVLHRDERSGYGWYILAIAREAAGDFKGSIACYESALALLPNHDDIANDLGRLAFRLGLKEMAAKFFTHYRATHPDCAQGANNLACALRDLQDYEGAIGVLRPAILANPGAAGLWNTLGTILGEQGQPASAMTFYTEALRLEPGFAKARYNLSNAKLDIGDIEGALEENLAATRSATEARDLAMMRLARSTILLCLGRVGEGWDDYEARLDPDFAGVTHFQIDRPRWTPGAPLAGRSLLLMGEQGLGDEVAFANLIPDVLEALGPDGRLTIALEPRLIPLFQRAFPTAVIGAHATLKVDGHTVRGAGFFDPAAIDLWAPLASPLRQFRRAADAFPARPGYLKPDPQRVAHWRGQIEALPGPKVGLLWKSLKLDGARLKYFSPFDYWRQVLATPGVSFVNLQYGDCAAELAEARERLGVEIWQPPGIDLKQDLDDVAALCCAMDLIIGPSNATSSIAGACGAPLWLVSTPGAWPRLGTDRYPWYPQARAFIPGGFEQWDPVMSAVAEALSEAVSSGRIGGTRAA